MFFIPSVKFIPCARVINLEDLFLPCVNFDRATRDHNKGCRRAIPAKEYYTHITASSINFAEINNPTGSLQPPPEVPAQQEVVAMSSGEKENWDNDDRPAPSWSMFEAIDNGMRNPELDIAVPSWAVFIVYGSRSARRNQKKKRRNLRQACRLS